MGNGFAGWRLAAACIACKHYMLELWIKMNGGLLTKCKELKPEQRTASLWALQVLRRICKRCAKSELRNLTRQRRRQQREEMQTRTPQQHVQMKAVVMLMLAGDTKWPIFLAKRWQWRHVNRVIAMPCEITEEWQVVYATNDRVRHMLLHLDDPDRVQIDLLLIQSFIYEEIESNNNKGLSVLQF